MVTRWYRGIFSTLTPDGSLEWLIWRQYDTSHISPQNVQCNLCGLRTVQRIPVLHSPRNSSPVMLQGTGPVHVPSPIGNPCRIVPVPHDRPNAGQVRCILVEQILVEQVPAHPCLAERAAMTFLVWLMVSTVSLMPMMFWFSAARSATSSDRSFGMPISAE